MQTSLDLGVISGLVTLDLSPMQDSVAGAMDLMGTLQDGFGSLADFADSMAISISASFDSMTGSIEAQVAAVDTLTESYDRLAGAAAAAASGNIRAAPVSYSSEGLAAAGASADASAASVGALDEAGAGAGLSLGGLDASASGLDAAFAGLDASAGGVEASLSALDGSAAAADGSLAAVGGGAAISDEALSALSASLDRMAGALATASGSLDAMSGNLAANTGALSANTTALGENAGAADATAGAHQAANDSMGGLGEGAKKLMLPLALAGGALVALGVASVHMAGDFDESMTQLVTGAGESQKNLALVSQGILQMAPVVGESTTQLAQGLYLIDSAGYHGAQSLQILQASAEGARVGASDLATVADATTTILTDFKGENYSAANAVNALTATVASGKTHMQDLAGSMSQILPTASAAHVSLIDVMGAMATMTGEAVPAAQAATFLRQTILALDAPSAGAQKALAAVGLSSTDVALEMQQSLPGAIQMVTDRLAQVYGEGSPQYVAALKAITGGSKTMQGMLDLSGEHLKAFQTNVTSVADSVKSGGSSINGWSLAQADFNTKLAQLGATANVTMIQLGHTLAPIATTLVAKVTPALEHMTEWITTHGPQTITIIESLAGAIGGGLLVAIIASVAALSPVTFAIAGIAIAVGALGAAAVLLATHWKQVEAFFASTTPVATAVKSVLIALGVIVGVIALALLPTLITGLVGLAVASWTALAPWLLIIGVFVLVVGVIALVVFGIMELVEHWGAVSAFFEHLWNIISDWVVNVTKAVVGWLVGVGQWFTDHLEAVWAYVVGVWLRIYDAIKGPLDAVLAFLAPIFDFITAVIRVACEIISKLIGDAWDWIWGKIVAVGTAIGDWLSGEWDLISRDVQVAWAAVSAYISSWWNAISQTVMNALTPLVTWLYDHWKIIQTDVTDAWTTIWGDVDSLWQRIITTIENNALALKNAILKPFQDAAAEIEGVVKGFANAGIGELNKAILGWQTMGNDLGDAINAVAKAVGVSDRVPALSLPQIPLLAQGAQNFGGGLAIVGEEGPEMVHLPAGASVLPAIPTSQLLKYGLGFLRGIGSGPGGIPGFAGGVGDFFGGLLGGAGGAATGLSSDLQTLMKEGPAGILAKVLGGFSAGNLPGVFAGLASGAETALEGWVKTYLGGLLNGSSAGGGLTYNGTAGGFANAANMSEFYGYFGDCGETAELLALHVLKGAALTGADLDAIVHRDQARGWAASNGVVSVGAIQQDLAQFEGIRSQYYGGGAWLSVLNEFAGKKPIIFLYSNAGGGLPGDERGVQWHFNTNLGSLGNGKWLFGDGDNSLAASGKLNIYTSANLAAANPNAELVVGMANGGVLTEPVMGTGLVSGGRYLLGEAGPEAVVPLGRRSSVGGASAGGDTYNITVQVVASAEDGDPYQAGVQFGNGFSQGFQQARTQRGL